MRVTAHDPVRPERPDLRATPFRAVRLGQRRELEFSIVESSTSRSVALQLHRSRGAGRPLEPEHPIHLFPDQIPAVIAALTEAAAALDAEPDMSGQSESPIHARDPR